MERCVLCNTPFNAHMDENVCPRCEEYLEELRLVQEWEYYVNSFNVEYEGDYEDWEEF